MKLFVTVAGKIWAYLIEIFCVARACLSYAFSLYTIFSDVTIYKFWFSINLDSVFSPELRFPHDSILWWLGMLNSFCFKFELGLYALKDKAGRPHNTRASTGACWPPAPPHCHKQCADSLLACMSHTWLAGKIVLWLSKISVSILFYGELKSRFWIQ